MTRLSGILASLLLTGFALTGCASSPPMFNCNQLSREAKAFVKQVRWRETGEALQHVATTPDTLRAAWEDALKGIDVIDCTIKELTCAPADDTAQSILTLGYVRSGTATLRTAEIPATWQYQPPGSWLLLSAPPKLP